MDEDLDDMVMDSFDYLEELDAWDEKVVEPVMYSSFESTSMSIPTAKPQAERY